MRLSAQEIRIIDYCNVKGYKLVKIYKDALHDETKLHSQFHRLLNEIQPGEIIIMADPSCLSRDTFKALNDINEVTKRKIGLIFVSFPVDITTPAGENAITLRLTFDRYDWQTDALVQSGEYSRLPDPPEISESFVSFERIQLPNPPKPIRLPDPPRPIRLPSPPKPIQIYRFTKRTKMLELLDLTRLPDPPELPA